MAFVHKVREGEHLSGLAAKYGFSSYRVLWNHSQNAELKKLRKNPNILFPGDLVFIPDREGNEFSAVTEQRHRFEMLEESLLLRVKVLALEDTPEQGPCSLVTDFGTRIMEEVEDHIFQSPISPRAEKGQLFFNRLNEPEKKELLIPIVVGSLHPVVEPSGQQSRLNNLGYFAGFSLKNSRQLKWALEEFQCDHLDQIKKLNPGKKVDGIADPATLQVLEQVYGM